MANSADIAEISKVSYSTTTTNAKSKPTRLPITVEKPTPYTFDLGYLLAQDGNPLTVAAAATAESSSAGRSQQQQQQQQQQQRQRLNSALHELARDGAQALLNQLLTTCSIECDQRNGGILLLTLPPRMYALPRHKPVPAPKQPTKWELFARKKGIGKYNKRLGSMGGSAQSEKRKKLVFDEDTGEWIPRWGYKGANKKGENDWLVEVDEKTLRKEQESMADGSGKTVRGTSRRERLERIKRNERKQRANERRNRKGGSA
ncbi:Rhodanese- sulfurtransferase [Ascosphaera aggregata]|nr:Rhodanese- sulfurtransferase [Ascosphaera aggregata]